MENTCLVCGKKIHVFACYIKRGGGKYCSHKCGAIAKTGRNNPAWKSKVSFTCQLCGRAFLDHQCHSDRKFCSRECANKDKRANRGRCLVCGKSLADKPAAAKYCSHTCYTKNNAGNKNHMWGGGGVERKCANCGKTFFATRAEVKYGYAKYCSQRCMGSWMSRNGHSSYAHGGKRKDLGDKYFRSSWEANYARYLNWLKSLGEIKGWRYEPVTFEFCGIKRGNRFYTPDFEVTEKDDAVVYHEIKGWMDDSSRVKLFRMSKYYPNVKVVIVDQPAYYAIARSVKGLIDGWEESKEHSI